MAIALLTSEVATIILVVQAKFPRKRAEKETP